MAPISIIGVGGAQGSGKTVLATALANYGYGYEPIDHAHTVTLNVYLGKHGVSAADIAAHLAGDQRDAAHPLLGGQTPRQVLARLIDTMGGEGATIAAWRQRTEHLLLVVADDVTTAEREAAVLAAGGKIVLVTRGLPQPGDHAPVPIAALDAWSAQLTARKEALDLAAKLRDLIVELGVQLGAPEEIARLTKMRQELVIPPEPASLALPPRLWVDNEGDAGELLRIGGLLGFYERGADYAARAAALHEQRQAEIQDAVTRSRRVIHPPGRA